MTDNSWDETTDIIVIGSGAAGMSAAISASHAGAEVKILERSDKLGGTSAVSGGMIWIPGNHYMHELGSSDSREEALTYLRSLSLGATDDKLAETYVDMAPQVLLFLEKETPLRFRVLKTPDYHPEFPGGKVGRSLTNGLFPANELGALRSALRPSPYYPIPVSMADIDDKVDIFDPEIIGDRLAKGLVGAGGALMAGLIKAVMDKNIPMQRGVRVRRLVVEDGVVIGVEGESAGKSIRMRARKAVIIASGGFEWNAQLVQNLLAGPLSGPMSPPFNDGDSLLMASGAGAMLANTAEAWWMPAMKIPGEESEGRQLHRPVVGERSLPGSVMVNRAGKRFVNEANNYADIGRALYNFDPVAFTYSNLPAWVIIHQGYLDNYPFLTRYPGDPIPNWLQQAPTLRMLAAKIGVDPDGLEETVGRFNAQAIVGRDQDFHRGESAYDVYYGDASREGSFQTLGPLDKPPFFACQVYSGALGTKGGPKTNEKSEVLNTDGGSIPGLYAAGNAAASFTGMAYPGGGATLGPALIFGYIAGREAASSVNRF